MATKPHLRIERNEPIALHDRAMDNLRFIRETMERAGPFTAVPGLGITVIGLTALAAAALARAQTSFDAWLTVWLLELALSVFLAAGASLWKARKKAMALLSHPTRKFVLAFAPPLAAGAVLTLVLVQAGVPDALPAMWLLLYGAAVVTGGAFSVRSVPLMGITLMGTGVLALLVPASWGDLMMAFGFGLVQIAFGLLIARRHGG